MFVVVFSSRIFFVGAVFIVGRFVIFFWWQMLIPWSDTIDLLRYRKKIFATLRTATTRPNSWIKVIRIL